MDNDVDLTQLPQEFHSLIPLIEEWAVADDVDRDSKMAATSTEELQRLADVVRPHFNAINAYLDDNDHLEEATYLGTLAESAAEAGLELEDRADA